MRPYDFSDLLQPATPDPPFRQGVVVAYNTGTGQNTIDVGGALLQDLPLLNIGDTVNLAVGNVVVLMKLKSSWAILGRVLSPLSSSFAADAVKTFHGQNQVSNFAITTSFQTFGTFTFTTPAFANQCLIYGTAQVTAENTSGASDRLNVILDINGAGGGEGKLTLVSTAIGAITSANSRQIGVTSGQTITLNGRVKTTVGNWAADSENVSTINSVAIFTKV